MKKILLTSIVGLMTAFGAAADAGKFVLPRAVERALEQIYDDKNDVPTWFRANVWLYGMGNKVGIDLENLSRRCENAIDPSAVKGLHIIMKDVTGEVILFEKTDKAGVCKVMIENVVRFHNQIIELNNFLDYADWEPDLNTKQMLKAEFDDEKEALDDVYYIANIDMSHIESDIRALYPMLGQAKAVFRTSDDSFVCVSYDGHHSPFFCRESVDSNIVFDPYRRVSTAERRWTDPAMREKALRNRNFMVGSQGLKYLIQDLKVKLDGKIQVASGL